MRENSTHSTAPNGRAPSDASIRAASSSAQAATGAFALPDTPQARPVHIRTLDGNRSDERADVVACEEPLEIQVGPASLAVVMRTPGHDEELALGFMITERVVRSAADIVSIRHCSTTTSPEAEDNIVRVILAPHVEIDLAALRRNIYASSSCGICGKATIENALAAAPPLTHDPSRFAAERIRTFVARLAEGQEVFRSTGGLHAAALFDSHGRLLVVREDVGRHNATDKAIGWAAARSLVPLAGHALVVSGRVSYEIVQKALAARIPLVAAVSAPTSLAIELADASGIAIVGFLRGDSMNVYTHSQRVVA
ncbi:MAG: formate dehydrogenase accessory sulfurtransferase FdhD [Candidatus Binatia bacterium]